MWNSDEDHELPHIIRLKENKTFQWFMNFLSPSKVSNPLNAEAEFSVAPAFLLHHQCERRRLRRAA